MSSERVLFSGGGRVMPADSTGLNLLLGLTRPRGTTTTETGLRLGGGVGTVDLGGGGGRGRSRLRKQLVGRKDDEDVPVIDLDDEDDDKPIPSSSQSKITPGSTSMDIIPCPEDTRIAQMTLKMTKEIRQEYEAQAIKDSDKIQTLEDKVHELESRVKVVTVEREELKRKLAREEVTMKSLKACAKKAEEQLRQTNSILPWWDHELAPDNLFYADPEPEVENRQGQEESTGPGEGSSWSSAITNQVEMTISDIKMEPPEAVPFYEEEYQDNDMGYYEYQRVTEFSEPESPPVDPVGVVDPVENDGDESVAVVLGMVRVEAPPLPPSFLLLNQRKSSKLLRKAFGRVRRRRRPRKVPAKVPNKVPGVPRVVQKRKKKTIELCPDEDVHSIVFGPQRDRRLLGLRSSPTRCISKLPLQRKPKAPRRVRRLSASTSTASTLTASTSTASTSTSTVSAADVTESGANPSPSKSKRPRLSHSDLELAREHGQGESKDGAGHFCLCGKSFEKKSGLTHHLKYFGEWKFKCEDEDCEELFFSTYNLGKHMEKVHKKTLPDDVRRCAKCGKIFTKQDLARHRSSKCSGLDSREDLSAA